MLYNPPFDYLPSQGQIRKHWRKWQNPGERRLAWQLALALLAFEALLSLWIIHHFPYSKGDWNAYMAQIARVESGERDFSRISDPGAGSTTASATGAGHVLAFWLLKAVTRGHVWRGQLIFASIYVVNQLVMMIIYIQRCDDG